MKKRFGDFGSMESVSLPNGGFIVALIFIALFVFSYLVLIAVEIILYVIIFITEFVKCYRENKDANSK